MKWPADRALGSSIGFAAREFPLNGTWRLRHSSEAAVSNQYRMMPTTRSPFAIVTGFRGQQFNTVTERMPARRELISAALCSMEDPLVKIAIADRLEASQKRRRDRRAAAGTDVRRQEFSAARDNGGCAEGVACR
jgi:hypothetical protein